MLEKFTIGFEVEFIRKIARMRVVRYLESVGFFKVRVDASVDFEENVTVVPSAADIDTIVALLSIIAKTRRWTGINACTGNHIHLAYKDGNYSFYARLFDYARHAIPVLTPFFVNSVVVDGNSLILSWCAGRRYWAGIPGHFESACSRGEYPYCQRMYWAVTPNPAEDYKPFTLEFRICETWPGYCTAGIYYIIAGFFGNVRPPRIEYYLRVISVADFMSFIEAVENAAGDIIPSFAKRIARMLATRGQPEPDTQLLLEIFSDEIRRYGNAIFAKIVEMLRLERRMARKRVGNLTIYVGDRKTWNTGVLPLALRKLIEHFINAGNVASQTARTAAIIR